MNQENQEIREWGDIRGLRGNDPQVQMYRLLEEIAELHKAITTNDIPEIEDAIGDIQVVLIQLAKSYNKTAEEMLQGAFGVIKYRKGLTSNNEFIRYAKLSKEDQLICDNQQGSPGGEYFVKGLNEILKPKDFLRL